MSARASGGGAKAYCYNIMKTDVTTIIICATVLLLFFSGEPDLMDSITTWIGSK